jgi:HlyD family secretion protein
MNEVPKYWVELIAFSTMIGLVLFLLFQTEGNLLQILPKLGVFAMASYKLLPAFQQVYANATYIKSSSPALDNIYEDMSLWYELSSKNFYSQTHDEKKLNFSKSLVLSNIIFKYPKNEKSAVENISMSILPNQLIGFVGESGSGKSTLADLIIGLITQNSGEILIDGVNLGSANLRAWQNAIGYVPQSIFLADASIAENIAFGVKLEDIDFQQINKVIKLSNLDDTVSKLTNGVNTIIGEQGVQLSGGQRQRIAIARALYQDPNILVFDEATSALDGLTEKSIMNSIKALSKTKTIILIAHRLNTVKDCNQVFLFNNGKLEDSGSYEELKNNNSEFHKMIDNG